MTTKWNEDEMTGSDFMTLAASVQGVTSQEKFVLFALSTWCGQGGKTDISNQAIASFCCLPVSSVGDALKRLEFLGLIRIRGKTKELRASAMENF